MKKFITEIAIYLILVFIMGCVWFFVDGSKALVERYSPYYLLFLLATKINDKIYEN